MPDKRPNTGYRRRSAPPPTARSRKAAQSKKRARRSRFHISLGGVLLFFVLMTVLFLGSGAVAYAYFASQLPDPSEAQTLNFETTKIYDRNGVLLYEVFDPSGGKRTHVSLAEISPYLINATIATEDASFYTNPGIDFKGIARAVYIEFVAGGSSGGSTITQQLVRASLLQKEQYERTYTRKIKEAILAVEFSRRFSKDQIIEMYLNNIPYGNMAYGIEAAAQGYFGKMAKDLDLAEASLLAGLPQAPSAYEPTHNFDRAKQRQQVVLGLMVKQGYITQAEADAAYNEELHFVQRSVQENIRAPHFVHYVQQVLEEKYGPEALSRGGLTVYTTLDIRYQEIAERVAAEHIATLADSNVHNAALVSLKPKTGEILAMVGSVDYYNEEIDGQVNVAISDNRQPGSSFKPIAYATAFEKGWTPGTMILDVKTKFPTSTGEPYVPENYDLKFHGPMLPREALANSYNIPAVKAIEYAGLHDTLAKAHEMGITGLQDESQYGLSLSLGGGAVKLLDLTSAFGTLANGGLAVPSTSLLRVLDTNGKVIDELQPDKLEPKRALSEEISFILSSMLSDDAARAPMFGSGSMLQLSRPAAAKTGTTNDYKDGWTMGYTPYLVTGVWTGNTNGDEMNGEPGVRAAAPIWHNFMEEILANPDLEAVLKDSPDAQLQMDFVPPEGVVKVTVCKETGMLPGSCPNKVSEWFVKGTEPKKKCEVHTMIKICKDSGLLATEFCPAESVEEKAFTKWPKEVLELGLENTEDPPTDPCDMHGPNGSITDTVDLSGLDSKRPDMISSPDFPNIYYEITSPATGQAVSGVVPIIGTAYMDPDMFQFYKVEYGKGRSPSEWMLMSTTYADPMQGGQLDLWNTDILEEGLYTIRLTVVNTKGNFQTPFKVRVFVERTPAGVAIISPAGGSTSESPVYLEAQASAGSGIAAVQFYGDGKLIGTITEKPYAMNWDAPSGEHSVYALAITRSQETVRSERVSFTIAGGAEQPRQERPAATGSIVITSPSEGAVIPAGTITIMTDSPPDSGITKTVFYIDGNKIGVSTMYPFGREWEATPGYHQIMAVAYDASGQELSRHTVNVTVQ